MESLADPFEPIQVKVSLAQVRRGKAGGQVPLSRRERELVVALAFRTQPCPVRTLGASVYTDLGDKEARNNVKVYICRLRQRVAPDFIVWGHDGYVFGPNVQTDLEAAKLLVQRLSQGDSLPEAEREAALAVARELRADAPEWMNNRDWYAAVGAAPQRLGRDLTLLIGRDALDQEEPSTAARIARELTYEDPCDEEAWELLIRAQLRSGEHGAALQGFRFYTVTLAREMQALPSPHLRRLVSEAIDKPYLAS
jgi:DNA-binding SARP family transcriptional activator